MASTGSTADTSTDEFADFGAELQTSGSSDDDLFDFSRDLE